MRKNITSGAAWEPIVGYSRAVVVGDVMEIAGTTAVKGGEVLFHGDAGKQAEYILSLFEKILNEEGFSLEDVVRTRVYLTNIEDWKAVGEVHGKFFGNIRPASMMVGVSAFVVPEMLVEIEATVIRTETKGPMLS